MFWLRKNWNNIIINIYKWYKLRCTKFEKFSTQISGCSKSLYSLVLDLVTNIVLLFVFLGLDFGS